MRTPAGRLGDPPAAAAAARKQASIATVTRNPQPNREAAAQTAPGRPDDAASSADGEVVDEPAPGGASRWATIRAFPFQPGWAGRGTGFGAMASQVHWVATMSF